jgi:hypothetical protein
VQEQPPAAARRYACASPASAGPRRNAMRYVYTATRPEHRLASAAAAGLPGLTHCEIEAHRQVQQRRRRAASLPPGARGSAGRTGHGLVLRAHHEQLAVVRRQEVAHHLPRRDAGRRAFAAVLCTRAAAPRTAVHQVGRSPHGAANQAERQRVHAVEQGRGCAWPRQRRSGAAQRAWLPAAWGAEQAAARLRCGRPNARGPGLPKQRAPTGELLFRSSFWTAPGSQRSPRRCRRRPSPGASGTW